MTTLTLDPNKRTIYALCDTTAGTKSVLNTPEPVSAMGAQPVEDAAQFLTMVRSKRSIGGGFTRIISGAADLTVDMKIARVPYTKYVKVTALVSLTGASNDTDSVTVALTTDTDATGDSDVVNNSSDTTVDGASKVELIAECGAGDNTDMGIENGELTFTRSNDGILRVFSVTREILPMYEVTV